MMNVFQLGQFGRRRINQGGAGGGGPRTIVRLTSDLVNPTYPLTLSWPTPSIDGLGAYSSGSPTRLTIPTTGVYVIYACQALSEAAGIVSEYRLRIIVNGSSNYIGRAEEVRTRGTDPTTYVVGTIVQSAPLYLTAGDYVQIVAEQSNNEDILGTATMPTLAMLYQVSSHRGALAYLSSDITAINGNTVPSLGTEAYDTDSIWSSGAPTDFVMPATGYAEGILGWSTNDGSVSLTVRHGGRWNRSGTKLGGKYTIQGNASPRSNVYTGPVPVTASQVLQAQSVSTDTSYTLSAGTGVSWAAVWFHDDDCTVVGLSADITALDATAGYNIVWSNEIADELAAWTSGSATRLTSPGGWVQVGASISLSGLSAATTDNLLSLEHYNSSNTLLATYSVGVYGITALEHQVMSPHLNTTAGDYFITKLTQTSADTSINILADGTRMFMRKFPA